MVIVDSYLPRLLHFAFIFYRHEMSTKTVGRFSHQFWCWLILPHNHHFSPLLSSFSSMINKFQPPLSHLHRIIIILSSNYKSSCSSIKECLSSPCALSLLSCAIYTLLRSHRTENCVVCETKIFILLAPFGVCAPRLYMWEINVDEIDVIFHNSRKKAPSMPLTWL